MLARTSLHLGQLLDVLEEQCRAQTRASSAAANDGADYDDAAASVDDRVPPGEELTFFHSRVLPKASLRTLAASMVRARVAVDLTTISIAVVLLLRYNATHPVTAHMMHRLFVACVLVGAKAHQDKFPCNKLLGTAVGVKSSEMNRIEWAIITALDWRLVVTQQDVNEAVVSRTPPCASFAESSSGDSVYVPCDDRRDVLSHACRAVGSSSTSPTRHRNADQHDVSCA